MSAVGYGHPQCDSAHANTVVSAAALGARRPSRARCPLQPAAGAGRRLHSHHSSHGRPDYHAHRHRPDAAWIAFRKTVPLDAQARPDQPMGDVAARWLKANPATLFYRSGDIYFPVISIFSATNVGAAAAARSPQYSVSIVSQVLFAGVTVSVVTTHLALHVEVGFRYRPQINLSLATVRPLDIVTQPVIGL
jgi:hypothetical protein